MDDDEPCYNGVALDSDGVARPAARRGGVPLRLANVEGR